MEAPLAAGAVIERTITSDIQGMDISAGPAISFLVDSATYTFSYYYPFPPDSGVRSGSITTSDDRTLTCTDRDATESSGHSQATEPTELDEVKDQLQSMTRY